MINSNFSITTSISSENKSHCEEKEKKRNLVLQLIFQKCPAQALLRFEHLCKSHYNSTITEEAWKNRRKFDHYLADWSDCLKEEKYHRWNYILNCAFGYYQRNKPLGKSLDFAREMLKSFAPLFSRFPSFGAYIKEDILEAASLAKPSHPQFQERKIIILENALLGMGGDLILQTLLEIKNYKLSKNRQSFDYRLILDYAKYAIEKDAVRIVDYVLDPYDEELSHGQQSLIFQAAKKNYWPPLIKFIATKKERYLEDLLKEQGRLPPILYRLFILTSDVHKKYQLLFESVKAYGDQVPAIVLASAAKAKLILEQWQEADEYYQRAIAAYGNKVSADVLENVGWTKRQLKQGKEAVEYYQKAIVAYGDKVPADLWASIGLAMRELKQWKEANEYYQKAIIAFGNQVPEWVLKDAARAKVKYNELF